MAWFGWAFKWYLSGGGFRLKISDTKGIQIGTLGYLFVHAFTTWLAMPNSTVGRMNRIKKVLDRLDKSIDKTDDEDTKKELKKIIY